MNRWIIFVLSHGTCSGLFPDRARAPIFATLSATHAQHDFLAKEKETDLDTHHAVKRMRIFALAVIRVFC